MLEIKIVIAFLIFCMALMFGLVPILARIQEEKQAWLFYGESFAGGVFLGAGLIHLLPDAQASFGSSAASYPWAFAICAISVLFLRLLEEGAHQLFAKYSACCTYHTWLAFLLVILLSVHSILAGVALGTEVTFAGLAIICFAILAHKGAAAFALGIKMRQSTLTRQSMVRLLFLFSLMTPIGIVSGSVLTHFLEATSGRMAEGIFNAIAAGTFLYIAVFEKISLDGSHKLTDIPTLPRLIYFSAGLTLMALIAIWL